MPKPRPIYQNQTSCCGPYSVNNIKQLQIRWQETQPAGWIHPHPKARNEPVRVYLCIYIYYIYIYVLLLCICLLLLFAGLGVVRPSYRFRPRQNSTQEQGVTICPKARHLMGPQWGMFPLGFPLNQAQKGNPPTPPRKVCT